jgi:hypothetical protein
MSAQFNGHSVLILAAIEAQDKPALVATRLNRYRQEMNMRDAVILSNARTPIGHPYGMSGACMVGHVPIEGKKRGASDVAVTMNAGAAAPFEELW